MREAAAAAGTRGERAEQGLRRAAVGEGAGAGRRRELGSVTRRRALRRGGSPAPRGAWVRGPPQPSGRAAPARLLGQDGAWWGLPAYPHEASGAHGALRVGEGIPGRPEGAPGAAGRP